MRNTNDPTHEDSDRGGGTDDLGGDIAVLKERKERDIEKPYWVKVKRKLSFELLGTKAERRGKRGRETKRDNKSRRETESNQQGIIWRRM